jgi:hypothetical protein
MSPRIICDICGTRIPPHAHYIVKMEIYADPSIPPIDTEELEESDPAAKMNDLIDQMKNMSADELMDQVHRHFEFRLCRPCHARFLANPLGMPREQSTPTN